MVDLASVSEYLARDHGDAGRTPASKIERPVWGRHSEVYLITGPAGERSVVRAFKSQGEGQRYACLIRRFHDRGLPLPRILWSDASLATRLRYRRSFCAEEFAEGSLLVDAGTSELTVAAVLRSLATLHDETSPVWGKPGRLRSGDYNRHLLRRCRRWIRNLPKDSPWLKPGDAQRWDELVKAAASRLPSQTLFSLIHGKLGADDIIVDEQLRSATFIDNADLSFGHFAHDLLYLLYYVAPEDAPLRRKLTTRYLEMRKQLPSGFDFEAIEPFFVLRHHLKKLKALHLRLDASTLAEDPRARFHYESLRELSRGA